MSDYTIQYYVMSCCSWQGWEGLPEGSRGSRWGSAGDCVCMHVYVCV